MGVYNITTQVIADCNLANTRMECIAVTVALVVSTEPDLAFVYADSVKKRLIQ